jgi:exopolysaccharide production protein ExoQ
MARTADSFAPTRPWIVGAIILIAGAPLPLLGSLGFTWAEPTHTVLLYLLLAAGSWAVFRRHSSRRRFLAARVPLVWVATVAVSGIWSVDRLSTAVAVVGLAATLLFACHLSTLPVNVVVRHIAIAGIVISVASLVSAYAWSDVAIYDSLGRGSLRGIMLHKNSLGRIAALSVLASAYLLSSRETRWLGLGGLVSSGSALALAQSNTAVASLIAALAAVALLWSTSRAPARMRPILLAAFACSVVVPAQFIIQTEPGSQFGAIDPDAATGRGGLWLAVSDAIEDKPLVGYGYRAFWKGWEGESASVLSQLRWEPTTSHNGYLDLILDIGQIGASLVLGSLLFYMLIAFSRRRTLGRPKYWLVGIIVFVAVHNVAETSIMRPNDLLWLLVAHAVFTTAGLGSRWQTDEIGSTPRNSPVTKASRRALAIGEVPAVD